MSWIEIKSRFKSLRLACEAGESIDDAWTGFVAAVTSVLEAPPAHLRNVLLALAEVERDRPRDRIVILDHGCGGGINLFFLAALGYRQVWGANTLQKAAPLNRVFREELGFSEDRIFVYDGKRLPLPDASVDLVLSQQVVEHVPGGLIEHYYAEEGRVLRPGGRGIHQVPHRLMPYDSHTRTWFIHYLPRAWRTPLYRLLGRDPVYVNDLLHLRGAGFHVAQVRKYIGPLRDLTTERLRSEVDMDDYDGPHRLRGLVGAALQAPLVGSLLVDLIRPLVMLETESVKPGDQPSPDTFQVR